MVVVVNVRSWKKHQLDSFETYIKNLTIRMAEEQPAHRFIFVSDEPIAIKTSLPANVTEYVLGPASKQLLLQKYWLDVRLPLWLRKIKADVFLSLDGMASLTTSVPQCLLVQDLRYLQEPSTYPKTVRGFYKRQIPHFLNKAKTVVVPTAFLQQEIATQYKVEPGKSSLVLYAVPDRFEPVSYDLKESVKAIFAQGHEYFLYKGLVHEDYNLINLLKAFSFFKKRQQSSWKLVLAGTFKEGDNTFQQLLETYKYKEDIIVTGPLGALEEAEIVASAYALISPSASETVDPAVWEAMRCEVPAIVTATATNSELFGDSVLTFNGDDPAAIAERVMHLYRHEDERRIYIEGGRQRAGALSWVGATASLWDAVVQAANS